MDFAFYLHEWTEHLREAWKNARATCDPKVASSTLVLLAEHVGFLDARAHEDWGGLYAPRVQVTLARSGVVVSALSALLFGFVRRESVASVAEITQIMTALDGQRSSLSIEATSEHARCMCSHVLRVVGGLSALQFARVVWLVQYLTQGLRARPSSETLVRLSAAGVGGQLLEVMVNLWADLALVGVVLSKISPVFDDGAEVATMSMLQELLDGLNGAQNALCCIKEMAFLRGLLEDEASNRGARQQIEAMLLDAEEFVVHRTSDDENWLQTPHNELVECF
jgi:hypothetical protein